MQHQAPTVLIKRTLIVTAVVGVSCLAAQAGMTSLHVDSAPNEVRVFRSMEEAETWLLGD